MAMISWTLRLPEELIEDCRRVARARGISTSDFVRRKLTDDLDVVDPTLRNSLEDLDRRLARLEEMAGV